MALKKGEYEGLTSGTNIPMFAGIETPAYGATWGDEYNKYWQDWYFRNGSIQNGMFVAGGATPEMYRNHIAVGAYNPAESVRAATQYLDENPKPIWDVAPDTSTRDTAAGKAKTGIEQAFRDYGITDLSPYTKNIEDRMAKTIAGIPAGTTDFDTYFGGLNLGQGLISELETPYRKTATDLFNKDIQTDYFGDTSDDAAIKGLIDADRPAANDFVKMMLDRGQILQPGYDAAIKDLDRQAGLGSTRLNEIGANLMNTHEGVMTTERNKRLEPYGKLKLGQSYDVAADDAALDKMASDFLGTLGTGLRTGLGTSPIFNTAGLGAIAGAAQGGQNIGGGQQAVTPPVEDPDEEPVPTQQDVLF